MTKRGLVALLVAALGPLTGKGEAQTSLRFDNGVALEFRLARSAEGRPSEERLGGVVIAGERSYRILSDRANLRYFGYTVSAERLPAKEARISFGSLRQELTEIPRDALDAICPGCRLALLENGSAPRFPPPQVVADGESLYLELLVNPSTGDKLVDVVTVRVQQEDASPSPRILRMKGARLLLNGIPLLNTASCEGPVIYFSVPGRGRVLVSAARREGFDQKAVLSTDRIEATVDGDRYEWVSADPVVEMPILPNGDRATVLKMSVWIRHEPAWRSPFGDSAPNTYSVGVPDETDFRLLDPAGQVPPD